MKNPLYFAHLASDSAISAKWLSEHGSESDKKKYNFPLYDAPVNVKLNWWEEYENAKNAIRWAPFSANWSEELKRIFGPEAREGIDSLEFKLSVSTANSKYKTKIIKELSEVLRQIVGDGVHCDVVPHLHTRALEVLKKGETYL